MAEPPPLPWVYPFQEDGPRFESICMRPVVPISLSGIDLTSVVWGLVDSGCDHVLAAPWLAASAGIDLRAGREFRLGLGGRTALIRFVPMQIRLHAPGPHNDETFIEWEDEVGFVDEWKPTFQVLLGQRAFMQRFTVSMSRLAQAVAVEDQDAFDRRYPAPLAGR